MIELTPFSDRQMDVIAHGVSERTSCFAGGAIRSGKTMACLYGFGVWIADQGGGRHHAICGESIETIMRNAGWPLMDAFESMGIQVSLRRDIGTRIEVEGLKEGHTPIWVVGAGDERARRRLLGATLKGLYVEELALLPESFFNVAWGRLSDAGAKMWASYNPENPSHWVKEKVIDRADQYDGDVYLFKQRDNPTLSDETIERYEASFTGHWHARMIEGEWAAASGLIFPYWSSVDEGHGLSADRIAFSMDWGISSVFHALAFRAKGMKADCFAELRHDGRVADPRTEQEHCDALLAWMRELVEGDLRGVTLWLDPSTPNSFKRLLRDAGLLVRNADNDVLPGIVTTAARLHSGELRIGNVPWLRRELGGYVWNEKRTDMGKDEPRKENDHGCDALRYYGYSTGKAYRYGELATVRAGLGVN